MGHYDEKDDEDYEEEEEEKSIAIKLLSVTQIKEKLKLALN